MCHIFVKPLGCKNLPTMSEVVDRWSTNSDWAWFSISHKDWEEVGWIKGLSLGATLFKLHELRIKKDLEDYVIALHLRFATHWGNLKELTHPFPINSDDTLFALEGKSSIGCLSHNWMLGQFLKKEGLSTSFAKIESDTSQFVRDYLPLVSDVNSLNEKIGYNKLVFVYPKWEVTIVNSHLWEWTKNGIWNSNVVTRHYSSYY